MNKKYPKKSEARKLEWKLGIRKGGWHHSKESKKKSSETHKRIGSRPPSPKGKKLSKKTKEKIRQARLKIGSPWNIGRKCSEETRRKIGEKSRISSKGRKHSEETKRKIGNTHRGMKRSKEARENISKSLRGRPKYHKRGPNSSNWKGGITPLNNEIRSCLKYVEWRRNIFYRDRWHCVLCGKRPLGKYGIQADHFPISFHKIIKKNKIKSLHNAIKCPDLWNIDNGRTLCRDCHNKTRK